MGTGNLDMLLVQPSGESWRGEIHKQGKIHGIDMSESTSDGYELALIAEECNQNNILTDYYVDRPDLYNDHTIQELVQRIQSRNPKIVGLEAMTCYSNNVIRLAKELKKADSSIVIFSGGYHPSGYPEMLFDAEGAIDYLVLGAGELTVRHLAAEILAGREKDEVLPQRERYTLPYGRFDGSFGDDINETLDKSVDKSAIAYLDGDRIRLINRTEDDLYHDADRIPIPKRHPEIHRHVVCGRLALPLPPEQITATMQITKGCPSSCSYCQSGNIFGPSGKKLVCDTSFHGRTRSVGNVIEELRYLTTIGVNCIFLTDLTTNLSGDYLRELSESIVKEKEAKRINPQITFYCMFKPHTQQQQKLLGLDYDIYHDMKRMGVIRIGFGIEFFNDQKLEDFSRNYETTDVYKHLKAADEAGIFTRGLSMYGTPDDRVELYAEYPDRMKAMPVDVWRMGAITPYFGTRYGNSQMRRLYHTMDIPRVFDNFNSSTLILLPEGQNITEKEILSIKKDILRKVYNSEEWQTRLLTKGRNYPELMPAIRYFMDRLHEQDFLFYRKGQFNLM